MTLKEKAAKTVEKLLALTQDNLIEWERIKDTRSITYTTNTEVEVAYSAEVNGNNFLVYEASYKTMDEEERLYWDSRIVVDMIDDDDVMLWRLPRTPGMWDLLEAIQVRAGNIEEKLDKFLDSE